MICSQCGAEIPDRSKFCPKCGLVQHRDSPEEPLTPELLPQQEEAVSGPERPARQAEQSVSAPELSPQQEEAVSGPERPARQAEQSVSAPELSPQQEEAVSGPERPARQAEQSVSAPELPPQQENAVSAPEKPADASVPAEPQEPTMAWSVPAEAEAADPEWDAASQKPEDAWEGLDEYREEHDEPDPYRDEPIPLQVGHADRGHGKLVTVFFALGVLVMVAAAVIALILLLSKDRNKQDPSGSGASGTAWTASGFDTTEETVYAPGEPDADVDCAGDYSVTLWVPEEEREQYEQLIRSFNMENGEGITIYPNLVGVAPGDTVDKLLSAEENGADLFCLKADRLPELVSRALITPLPAGSASAVRVRTDPKSLETAAVSAKLWAYPRSCDGPVLFYDRSVISDSAAASLDAILQACTERDRFFCFNLSPEKRLLAFCLAPGIDCRSVWTTDEDGDFVGVEDNLESDGLPALQCFRKLALSPQYRAANLGPGSFENGAAAMIAEASQAPAVREILGENFGAAPLPTFGLEGIAYHMGSCLSGELLAVANRSWYEPAIRATLHKLASYLTSAAAQTELYAAAGLCPTARDAQSAVRAEDSVTDALLKQREYSVHCGPVPSGWARTARQLATEVCRSASPEEETELLTQALRRYSDGLCALLMTEKTRAVYTAMGTINDTFWNKDFPLYEIRPGWCVSEVLFLKAGEEFKVRKDGRWDYNYGTTGRNGENCVVQSDGWYRIGFDLNTGEVSLDPRPAPADQEP